MTQETMKALRFGYGYSSNNKTMKMRYTHSLAQAILKRLPAQFHNQLSVAITMDYTFIACVANSGSAIWDQLTFAIRLGKADCLRAQADQLS